MENSSPSTPNSSDLSSKVIMTPTPAITELFSLFLNSGGQPKVTEFKKYLNDVINSDIKPLCARSGKSADGNNWRSALTARFSGRGAKWVQVALQEINPTISAFEEQGIDCSNYKTFIEMNGAAWIRFAGPRLAADGTHAAAFEVRTNGSTHDHPKQLHFIAVQHLDETIRPLGGTPRSLGLEVANDAAVTVQPVTETEVAEAVVAEEPESEVVIEVEAPKNMPPSSADPAEWEEFLKAEGLGADQFEGEDTGDLFASCED